MNTHYNFDFKWIMECVVDIAKPSTCKRSKCGSIIVSGGNVIIGEGYNSMPCNTQGECFKDSLPKKFKSDRTCCIHAEQRAIIDALQGRWRDEIKGSSLFFIRLDKDGNPEYAGAPYCTICSKMALDVGIAYFWLYHEDGWVRYDTKHYNDLSFEHANEKTELTPFADGLRKMSTRGALSRPVRINERMKRILTEMINDDKENTAIMFDEDDAEGHSNFMEAMTWLEKEIHAERNQPISKRVGWHLYCWMADNKYHHLSGEPDFDKAMQWITNKINKHYSQFELTTWDRKDK